LTVIGENWDFFFYFCLVEPGHSVDGKGALDFPKTIETAFNSRGCFHYKHYGLAYYSI